MDGGPGRTGAGSGDRGQERVRAATLVEAGYMATREIARFVLPCLDYHSDKIYETAWYHMGNSSTRLECPENRFLILSATIRMVI